MAFRPGGMSDESSSEDDCFYRSDKSKKRWSNRPLMQNGKSCTAIVKLDSPKNENFGEKEELQLRAVSACMTGNLSIINEYIQAGNNVNDFLAKGWTLLLYGASATLPEVVELLIKHGAKPNKNKDGYTPLMAVCDSTKGNDEQCLRCIKILMEAKANPNAHSKRMQTPLMFACASRNSTVILELLKHTKNIDAVDSDGRTALHYATLAKKPDIVKILLKNNASRDIMDRNELTAKDIASTKNFDKILALLNIDENEDMETICELTKRDNWTDLFPSLSADSSELINCDIAEILYGMGLEIYKPLFKGMKLNTFMKLSENDLIALGIDIALHRKQFMNNLHKFHTKPWSIRSIGSIKKHMPYTLYDGVGLLGNAARQIGIIGSSFQFIKSGLQNSKEKGISLSDMQKAEYCEELKKTERTLLLLKDDLHRVMTLAKKVEKENRGIVSAAYISVKEKKHNWTIIISITLMTVMYLSKTLSVQRLWNN